MPVSEAKLAANRANALKSKGPVTPEGRARSRGNALKHGMAGDGVVTLPVDSAEVERRSSAMRREMAPKSEMGRFLVHRLAELTVRVERCTKQERAAVKARVARAIDDFDEARVAEVDRLFAAMAAESEVATRRLRSMPEGVDRLIAALLDLGERLDDGRWDARLGERLAHLTGVSWDEVPACRPRALTDAIAGDFRGLRAAEADALPPVDRVTYARQAMQALIDAEVRSLLVHRETLDLEAIAEDRAGAPDRALFDASKEAILARRYEAAAERGVFQALKKFREVEAEAAATAEAEAATLPVEDEVEAELGSFRAGIPGPARVGSPTGVGCPSTPAGPVDPRPRMVGPGAGGSR